MKPLIIDYKKIGEKLRKERITQNLTQEYLAEAIDVNPSHISNIENHRTNVSLPTLVALCNTLNITVDSILSEEYLNLSSALDLEILNELKHCSTQDKEKILGIVRLF